MTSLIVRFLVACAAFAPTACLADIVVLWNFEDTVAPDVGSGSADLLGGTTASFDFGPFGGGNRALFTTDYATQQTQSGERGIAFRFSTAGFQDISVEWGFRPSGDSSKWIRLDYTNNNGGSWNEIEQFEIADQSANTFSFVARDFSTLASATDNPNFGLRFVSIYSPNAFTGNSVNYAANSAYQQADSFARDYSPAGTLAFDYFVVNGITAVPEPSAAMLVGVVLIAACVLRIFQVRLTRIFGTR